jgi:multiple sugar transport system substrate-binding protein
MRRLSVLLLVLAMTLSLALPVSAEEQVTLNLWHRWSGTNETILNDCVALFESENPGIKVDVTAKAGEYFELLQSMIADAAAGNEKPDVFVAGYNLLNYIATELNPVSVDQLAPDEAALSELYGRFAPEMLALSNVDGTQIGLPLAVSNMVMYCNMDIFKEAGLTEADIPTTWEEMLAVCETIKNNTSHYGIAIQLPDNWGDQALVFSAGGELLNSEKDRVDFTNDGCIKALNMWQTLYQLGYSPVATDTEQTANFSAGDIAMICTTIMKINTFGDYATFDLKIAECPGFEGLTKQLPAGGAAMISFSPDDARQAAAYKFMDFMTTQVGMELFTKTGYLCVTTDEVPMVPGQEAAYAQTQYARPWECWPGGSIGLEIDSRWLTTRNAILMENVDVVGALTALEEECNMMLENG